MNSSFDYNITINNMLHTIDDYNKSINNDQLDYTRYIDNKQKLDDNTDIEKDKCYNTIKSLSLLHEMYKVRNNKEANFNVSAREQKYSIDDPDIDKPSLKLPSWKQLLPEEQSKIINEFILIEQDKNELNNDDCINLYNLIKNNPKNIIYNKTNKTITVKNLKFYKKNYINMYKLTNTVKGKIFK
tara:strand:- start:176 stop:730 length:555 start_codon:yes stop_codon:yes gene_type:complete